MSTEAKHTPAKLVATRHGQIQTDDGQQVAVCTIKPDKWGPEVRDANAARLAHCWNCHDELLDSLEAVADRFESTIAELDYNDQATADSQAIDAARAAISKAKGGAL